MDGFYVFLGALIMASLGVALVKGRWVLVLLSIFVPFLSFFGIVAAFRLARPNSPWAFWFYGPDKKYPVKFFQSVFRFDRERFEEENMEDQLPEGWGVIDGGAGKTVGKKANDLSQQYNEVS